MKHPKKLLFSMLLLSAGTSMADVSIHDAWQQLLNEHAGLAAENFLIDAAQAQVSDAKAKRLPDVEFSSQWNMLNDELGLWVDTSVLMPQGQPVYFPIQDQTYWDTQITTTLPLYTGGKISAGIAASEADVAQQRAAKQQAQNELFTQFVRRFLSVNLTAENEHIRRLAFENLEQHLQRAIRMQEEGSIAYTERLQAEVERDKARREWRNAHAEHELAVSAYRALFTSQVALPDQSLSFRTYQHLNDNALALRAVRNHPGVAQINAQQAKAQAGLQASRAEFLPTVALFANVELATDDLTQLDPEWAAGIHVQWKLFGQGNRFKASARYKASIDAADLKRSQATRDIRILIEQKQTTIAYAEESYLALQSSITLAEENLRLRQSAFAQGIATSLDEIDAQLLLTGLQLESQKALYDYYTALSELTALTAQQSSFFQLF